MEYIVLVNITTKRIFDFWIMTSLFNGFWVKVYIIFIIYKKKINFKSLKNQVFY